MKFTELTQDRVAEISKILNANEGQAQELLALDPKEAAAKLNTMGHHFTEEELKAYKHALRTAVSSSLNDAALEGVAGGAGDTDVSEDAVLAIFGIKLGWKAIAAITGGAGVATGVAQEVRR